MARMWMPQVGAHRRIHCGHQTVLPHINTFDKDEWTKHHIFDRASLVTVTKAIPETPLARWITRRCNEQRIYVANPPTRSTPAPKPWHNAKPSMDWTYPPGWRTWEPKDTNFNFNSGKTMEEYNQNLSKFFEYVNIKDKSKQEQMTDGVEAWLMECGDDRKLIRGRHPYKNNRCFVTNDQALFSYLVTARVKLDHFLEDLHLPRRNKHFCLLVDIKMDAKKWSDLRGSNVVSGSAEVEIAAGLYEIFKRFPFYSRLVAQIWYDGP
uniref:Uncharacterized protein n=1 Tax=Physcomitrium patens TaxID=3218 RepID=A0A2K1LAZ5_PHYPA|nr:hypothetical protein PHYPA_001606 [Physcomitrium patens]